MTEPAGASLPHCSPSCSVSSGLLEMNVAMNSQRLDALPVANGQARFGVDPANATEGQFRKLFLPRIQQWHGVAGGHREQQFEILAVGERGGQRLFPSADMSWGTIGSLRTAAARNFLCRATDRDRIGKQLGANSACIEDVGQVTRKTIADVHHGVDRKTVGQPSRFGQPRLEFEMFPSLGTSKFAG